ncbi:MFS transporter [Terribacillus sp. DMT04]|uniref:MFS transporter n=1 Tax=Terribacillus sp. DMT04 TaxID=2850441 RepID=UPI001C2C2352|nr:MFS transporter [Terribacillus sp. DMT04]QXE02160.1 MFS transporter [Terribacillus sp. DMT04]
MTEQRITLTHPLSRLMMSTTIANMAGQVYSILLPLLVLEVTSSPIAVTATIAAERASMVLQPFVGPILDRANWKGILLLADIVRFACFLLLSALAASGHLSMLFLIALSFVIGFAAIFYQGAQFTAIPFIVTARQLHFANSLESALYQLSIVIGPSIGGVVLLFFHMQSSLIVMSTLAFFAVWLIFLLPYQQKPASAKPFSLSVYTQELKEGFAFIYCKKEIWFTNLILLISNFGIQFLIVLLVIYVNKLTHDPLLIGIVLSAGGIGAVSGTVLGFYADRVGTYRQILFTAKLIGGLSIIFISLTDNIWLIALLNLIGTSSAGAINPIIKTIRQQYTPQHLLGRVQASSRFITFTLLPVASICGGLLSEWIGMESTIMLGGGIATISVLFIWKLPRDL